MIFGHTVIAPWEKEMEEYFEKPDVNNDELQVVISGLLSCEPLHGGEWIAEWNKFFLDNYPEEYAKELVKKHLRFHPKWVMDKMGVERNDILFLYETFLEMEKNIFGILCGINRLYHPGKFKSVKYTIDLMKIKPDELYEKFMRVFTTGEEEGTEIICGLIEETLSIVDEYMPEIDTIRVRKIYNMVLRK